MKTANGPLQVYMIKGVGLSGVAATAGEQIGYSVADVTAKAIFGVMIWRIASEKSKMEEEYVKAESLLRGSTMGA